MGIGLEEITNLLVPEMDGHEYHIVSSCLKHDNVF